LDRNHARQCVFAVCTRNANADWVEGPEAHQSAFLVGKVRDVVRSPFDERKDRYLIEFSEYARINVPDVWKGDRNPVKYATIDGLGIDAAELKWEPMPPALPPPTNDSRGLAPTTVTALTLADAKKRLALTFGVPPDAIEITIRG